MPCSAKSRELEGETAISPDNQRAGHAAALACGPAFHQYSGSAEDDHFVDGITETLTTDLCALLRRLRDLAERRSRL